MQFKILPKAENEKYGDEILKMLITGDDEFVPPLSERKSTTQSSLNGGKRSMDGIISYFNEIKNQRIAVATENDELIAFVSYREDYTCDQIGQEYLPNIYISTLIVKPEGRGKGLTQRMYGSLFEEYKNSNILTRTWSTNLAHIKILSKFNFETLAVLKDHRGEGIDTVYFIKNAQA